MAISGRFEADFASFYEACRQAQVSLKGFEASNREVERSVNEMVDSFSGRRVVSEATVMADAVGKIGGPARLTQTELRRVGQVADEAIEKMNRWGQAPPRNLLRLADAAKASRSGLSEMAGQIRQVDNVLDVFGVHLGPARKAIDDLGYAAENGAGKLGLVGTAGLALGAAIGGWQIGRAIAEFAGLDEKIGDVTASLLGLPTVAEQAAAATADAIAKARAAHPELNVQTGETARLLNQLDAEAKVKANQQAAEASDRLDAVARVQAEIKKVYDEVDAFRKQGLVDELNKQINAQVLSLSDLAKQYHLSDQAMQIFAKDAANVARIQENNSKKLEGLRNEFLAATVDRAEAEKKAAAEGLKALEDQAIARVNAYQAQKDKNLELMESEIAVLRQTEATTKALREQEEAARATAEAVTFSRDYDLSTPEGLAEFKRLNPSAFVSSAATPEYFKTRSLADAVRDGLIQFNAGYGNANARTPIYSAPPPPPAGSSSYGFGPSGTTLPPPPPAFRTDSGARSRPDGITQVYAPVIVSGVFDPSSSHALGSVVSKAMFQAVADARVLRD